MPRTDRRRVVAAADIQTAADAGRYELPIGPDDVVTPLARDVARECGVALVSRDDRLQPAPGDSSLAARVRHIVTELLGEPSGSAGSPVMVRHVDSRQVCFEPFPFDGPGPEMTVQVADVVTPEYGATMGAGFLTLTRGSFPWSLTYDEVEYVLEGELHLGTDNGVVVGRPGDILYVPKGSNITFGTPSWVRLLYVTYPADWAAGLP